MALVRSEEDPDIVPITIPEAVGSLLHLITDVVRKNRTLIDYYIYPREVPSEVEAYKPRLQVLYNRVESLAALDLTKLALIADDAPILITDVLLPVITQVLKAIHGMQHIFVTHYDRGLEYRRPYQSLSEALEYRLQQLELFQEQQLHNPQWRPAEYYVSQHQSWLEPSFCRYAIAYTNENDQGKLTQVMTESLTLEEKQRLRSTGGAYLWWDCPGCLFKLKFYVSDSKNSNVHTTDDLRTHASARNVEYRPAFLIKCHLYQPKSSSQRSPGANEGRLLLTDGRRQSTNDIQRQFVARRQSEAKISRHSLPFFPFSIPRRTKSDKFPDGYGPRTKGSGATLVGKYGCPFCFVTGQQSGHMEYRNGKELVEHIETKHHARRPPSSLMLDKFMVGLDGRCSERVNRWDLVSSTHIRSMTFPDKD